jgi:2'-5' RNA ligase
MRKVKNINQFALLLLWTLIPIFSSARQPVALGEEPAQTAVNNGQLFSLIEIKNTDVGNWWAKLYPEAKKQFPSLNFVAPEDLHVTLLIIGPWKMEDLPELQQLALVYPRNGIDTSFQLSLFGADKEWLVLEFLRLSPQWVNSVTRAKEKLNREHLSQPTPYDHAFKAHISLAEAPLKQKQDPVKNIYDTKVLIDFQLWLYQNMHDLSLKLTSQEVKDKTVFWLYSATRPADYSTYIPLSDWLRIYFPKQVVMK